MKSNNIRHMLLKAGDLKHSYNVLHSVRECDDITVFIDWSGAIDLSWYNPDYGEYETQTIGVYNYRPGSTDPENWYGSVDPKATRKLYTALMTNGLEGVLELLEKTNAAMRALMWKEVKDENWES